jgi:hypothetical protein
MGAVAKLRHASQHLRVSMPAAARLNCTRGHVNRRRLACAVGCRCVPMSCFCNTKRHAPCQAHDQLHPSLALLPGPSLILHYVTAHEAVALCATWRAWPSREARPLPQQESYVHVYATPPAGCWAGSSAAFCLCVRQAQLPQVATQMASASRPSWHGPIVHKSTMTRSPSNSISSLPPDDGSVCRQVRCALVACHSGRHRKCPRILDARHGA